MKTLATQHTVGPWSWDNEGDDGINVRGALKGIVVAYCSTGDSVDDESKANARLIAAAPELLVALKQLYEESAFTTLFSEKVEALIAKAEGRE